MNGTAPVALATVVCALLYLLAALRLVCYRPNGARHRPGVSALACVLIASLACRALAIILGEAAPTAPERVAALLLCALLFAIGGNLAVLLPERRHV